VSGVLKIVPSLASLLTSVIIQLGRQLYFTGSTHIVVSTFALRKLFGATAEREALCTRAAHMHAISIADGMLISSLAHVLLAVLLLILTSLSAPVFSG
jgi:hypothetical protein